MAHGRPAPRQVVMVHGWILRNGGPRTVVLTVDRIYFLARVHGLVVDPGRLHLPACFCDSIRIYVRIQWLSDSYVFVHICARNREHYGKSTAENLPTLSAYLFTFISRETSCYDLASNGILQEKSVSYILLVRYKLIPSNRMFLSIKLWHFRLEHYFKKVIYFFHTSVDNLFQLNAFVESLCFSAL